MVDCCPWPKGQVNEARGFGQAVRCHGSGAACCTSARARHSSHQIPQQQVANRVSALVARFSSCERIFHVSVCGLGPKQLAMPETALHPTATKPLLQARLEYGMALHEKGELADAERIYREVLQQQPDHFNALHMLGVIAIQTGHPEQGVHLITQAIGLGANFAAAHSNLGNAQLNLNHPQEALASFERAIALAPYLAVAHNNRGKALLDLKRPEDALASFERAIALQPDFALAHSNRGKALLDLSRPEDARSCFEKALSLKRELPEAWNNLACALHSLCCWKEAEEASRKAVTLKPDYADAWTDLGYALNQLDRWDEAVGACRTAITLKSDHAWNPLGYALTALGRWSEAEEACRKAVRFKSDDSDAWCNLSRALAGQKRLVEALTASHRAAALKPNSRGPSDVNDENLRKVHEAVKRLVAQASTNGGALVLNEEQIRKLHQIAMHGLLPNPGEYRKSSVMIAASLHLTPNWAMVPALMEDMCRHINANWHLRDAFHLGAFILWRLIWIHPFSDGNGRIARAVCYAVLGVKNASSLPMPIEAFVDKRSVRHPGLIDCLEYAHDLYSQTQNIEEATRHVEQWLRTFIGRHSI